MTTVRQWTGREASVLRAALRLSVRDFAAKLGVDLRTVTKWQARGAAVILRPYMQAVLDTALERASDEAKARFEQSLQSDPSANEPLAGLPWETADLVQRMQASDVSTQTLECLEATVFELCCQYPYRDAGELRREAQRWLGHVGGLLRRPVGLRQHQELLVSAGWLALLVGCLEYDLGMRAAAEATRVAARQLGDEAGYGEIVAWSHEMSAWFALTQGRYTQVVEAAEAGQYADSVHSVRVQLLAQEAKALGRIGDIGAVHGVLERGAHTARRADRQPAL